MTDEIVIVDSGGANIASLQYALSRLGATAHVSRDAAQISQAQRVLLPGVGSAASAMRRLEANDLCATLRMLRQPVLGICLGMQLLFESSAEATTACLGIVPGHVDLLVPRDGQPVPHMGWNQINAFASPALLRGIDSGEHFYFVHSYAAAPNKYCVARCDYGGEFAAIVQRENFWGVQFHPERSGHAGAQLLANFLDLDRCN